LYFFEIYHQTIDFHRHRRHFIYTRRDKTQQHGDTEITPWGDPILFQSLLVHHERGANTRVLIMGRLCAFF
jgi:hypothetical protein